MKLAKRILVTSVAVFSVFAVFSVADAKRLQDIPVDESKALEFIDNPCKRPFTWDFGNLPDVVGCSTPTGSAMWINIPVPWMADQVPELGLVSLPTFIAVTWDGTSFSYSDTASRLYEYPPDDPTERLYGLQFQVRVTPQDWWVTLVDDAGVHVGNVNFRSDQQSQMGMWAYDEVTKLAYKSYSNPTTIRLGNICKAGAGRLLNQVLAVPEMWGGYGIKEPITVKDNDDLNTDSACSNIFDELDSSYLNAFVLPDTTNERYINWGNALQPQAIIAFSEIASKSGSREMFGAPAYVITATTNVIVEARVFWTRHYHKYEEETTKTKCSWDYEDDYEFIDDTKEPPEPIYCKKVKVAAVWGVYCEPKDESCYGRRRADTWWRRIGEARGDTIRNQFGEYVDNYEIVVIQAQPLLDAP